MKRIQHSLLLVFSLSTGVWVGATTLQRRQVHIPVLLDTSVDEAATAPVCTSPKCQQYAKHILASLAPNYTAINPCVEFDRYACDGWRSNNTYRPDQAALSVTTVLSDSIRDLLHAMLEGQYAENTTFSGANKEFDIKNFNTMKTAYKSCMNEDAIKAYGIAPMRKLISEFEAVYPLNVSAKNATDTKQELTKAITWLYKRNVAGLLAPTPTADDMNPNTMVISMDSSEIQMPKQYYNKSIVLTNYTRAIAQTYYVLESGKSIDEEPIPSSKNASLFEKAQRIVNFEKLVAQNVADPEVLNDVKYHYNAKTLSEVEAMVPQIFLQDYLKSIAPPGYDLSSNQTVILSDINFYKNLSNIVQSTPRVVLHDYFEWRLIRTWSDRLHNNYTIPLRRFNNLLVGREPDVLPERWRTCITEIDTSLGHLLSGAFISRAFSRKDKELGDQIIRDIRNVFRDAFKKLDWMTDKTEAVASKKVLNLIQKVGFQTKNPDAENPEELNSYYRQLTVADNFFENGQTALQFTQNKTWYDLLKPTDRDQWGMTASTVNAYFNPPLNEIVFPAGIMQMPFFSGDLPQYISYGAFGATAGHELTHAFDDNGSKYDEEGRYRDWWDNATTVRFENKTDCFVQQYGKYSVEGLEGERVPVNGKLTLGENIADAGGLNAAYRAWKLREAATPNPMLPGLESWTNDQLFFLSYANSWCEKTRPEKLLQQVLSDPHSPADKRVLGPLDNSPEFKRAFNCPVKTATCELW